MDLNQVIELFESKHTADLADRHAQSIQQLCSEMNNELVRDGFFYMELDMVTQVLRLILQSLHNGKIELMPALSSLLEVLNIPFQRKKSSDELTIRAKIPNVLNALCDLILFELDVESDPEGTLITEWEYTRQEIANTLTNIASQGIEDIKDKEPTEEEKKIYGTQNAIPLQRLFKEGNRNLQGFADSNVPATLVGLLSDEAVRRSSIDTMISVLEAIAAISLYKPITDQIIMEGVGRDLVRIISQTKDFRSYIVSLAIEALWNLIEVGGKQAIHQLAIHPEVIPSLKAPFEMVLRKGYKKDDKCLRNEICVLINYVVSNPESHKFFLQVDGDECILEQMITYAVIDEVAEDQQQPIFNVTDEDLELKKLLWTQIFSVCHDGQNMEAHNIMMQKSFLRALLLYLDPQSIEQNDVITRWAPPQLFELQIHGLNIISHLVSLVPQHFHEIGGHKVLAAFIESFKDIPRRKAVLMALMSTSFFDFFKVELMECGLVKTLLDLIQNQTEAGTLYIRELSFNILSNICKDCRDNQKSFRRLGGIEILKDNMQNGEVDQSGNATTFILATLDCLQNAIFGNKRSELHFLDVEGVQILLDLIESCDYTLKRIALSCLCTILENQKSFQYFMEWNSHKSSLNATQLLIKLYQEENTRFGVRFEKGILQDMERPLLPKLSYLIQKYANDEEMGSMSRVQSRQQSQQKAMSSIGGSPSGRGADHDGSAHQSAMNASMGEAEGSVGGRSQNSKLTSRSKASRILRMALEAASNMGKGGAKYNESYVSNVLSKIVKDYDLRSTIFGTFYRVGFDLHELNAGEKQIMEIIQLYPFLKNGEIWQDIKQELDDLNIKPTGDDCHWLESSIEEAYEQTQQAVQNQQKLEQEVRDKDQAELDNYFAAISLKKAINSGGANSQKNPTQNSQTMQEKSSQSRKEI